MARAKGAVTAVATTNFDVLLGARRGTEHGDILTASPCDADRLELERLSEPVRRGNLVAALGLLKVHYRQLDRRPLLADLHTRVCERLVFGGKLRFARSSERALRALNFSPQPDRGQLFDSPQLQAKFDAGLVEEARRRSLNLLKADLELTEDIVSEAAYRKEFEKWAGAQCFRERERLCRDFLDGPVPANLREVTAWRSVIAKLLDCREDQIERERVIGLLRGARTAAKRAEAPFRRRQRYVR